MGWRLALGLALLPATATAGRGYAPKQPPPKAPVRGRGWVKANPAKPPDKVTVQPKRRPDPPLGKGRLPRLGEGLLTAREEYALAECMEVRDVALWDAVLRSRRALPDVIAAILPPLRELRKTHGNQNPNEAAQQRFDVEDAERAVNPLLEARSGRAQARRELAVRLRRADPDRVVLRAALETLRAMPAPAQRTERWRKLMQRVDRLERRAERPRTVFRRRNMGLVGEYVRGIEPPRGVSKEDIRQAATFGLVRAINRFDRHKGLRFSTKATWWVRGEGQKAWMASHIQNAQSTGSLTVTSGGEDWTREPAAPKTVLGARVMQQEQRAALQRLIQGIDARQRSILVRRFGLQGEPETLKEIAADLGVSKERVRQLEAKGLKALRDRAAELGVPLEELAEQAFGPME